MEIASLLGLSAQAETLLLQAEKAVQPMFEEVDRIAEYNQAKVLKAFAEFRIQAGHFQCSSGYGYSDIQHVIRHLDELEEGTIWN